MSEDVVIMYVKIWSLYMLHLVLAFACWLLCYNCNFTPSFHKHSTLYF